MSLILNISISSYYNYSKFQGGLSFDREGYAIYNGARGEDSEKFGFHSDDGSLEFFNPQILEWN